MEKIPIRPDASWPVLGLKFEPRPLSINPSYRGEPYPLMRSDDKMPSEKVSTILEVSHVNQEIELFVCLSGLCMVSIGPITVNFSGPPVRSRGIFTTWSADPFSNVSRTPLTN